MKFRIIDKNGKDVTDTRDWYLDLNGNVYIETDDIDMPIQYMEEYSSELVVEDSK